MSDQQYQILLSKINQLSNRISQLEQKQATFATESYVDKVEVQIYLQLNDLISELQRLSEKLAVVQLPEDTRYYLNEREVAYLRSLGKELNTVKAEVERTLQAVLARLQYLTPTTGQ
jgi:phage shock protein A